MQYSILEISKLGNKWVACILGVDAADNGMIHVPGKKRIT